LIIQITHQARMQQGSADLNRAGAGMQRQTAGHPRTTGDSPASWSRTFPATPEHTSHARRFLAAILDGSPLTADALACLAELASNAVVHSDSRHPGGTFTVRAHTRPGKLLAEVEDHGGPWAPPPNPGGPDDASGRGLLIVAALADAWDIIPKTTAPRRIAWFLLRTPQQQP
jgi:anti-sigma regulatory factor (Ser/Thr protein kinase)